MKFIPKQLLSENDLQHNFVKCINACYKIKIKKIHFPFILRWNI